jgi:hypothetical protein
VQQNCSAAKLKIAGAALGRYRRDIRRRPLSSHQACRIALAGSLPLALFLIVLRPRTLNPGVLWFFDNRTD